jgi:hypothetical protein
MAGLTDFITQEPWSDIFLIWLVEVDDAYTELQTQYGEWRQRGPAPRFTDSEVITVALIIDTFFHGHEALGLSLRGLVSRVATRILAYTLCFISVKALATLALITQN